MTLLKSDIRDDVPGEISAITEKTSAAPNDVVLIEDSADDFAKKKMGLGNVLVNHQLDVDKVDWSPTAIALPVALPATGAVRRFVAYNVECIATAYGRMTVAPTRFS